MYRSCLALALCLLLPLGVEGAPQASLCGTSPAKWREEVALHTRTAKLRLRLAPQSLLTRAQTAQLNQDSGNIAVLPDAGDLVMRQKLFNLDGTTLALQPSDDRKQFTYTLSGPSYDSAAADQGVPLDHPPDDGVTYFKLPFDFPLYGDFYNEGWIDSDGNIQFLGPTDSGGDRSLGQLITGPLRLAPLFTDLDPTSGGSIRVYSDPGRVVVSWVNVPEYSDYGIGLTQTFQARLYADGRIEYAYNGVTLDNAIVGVSPGRGDTPTLVDFLEDPSTAPASTVAEVFSDSDRVDMISVARRFYQTHDDAYDYLMVYNNMGIGALGAIAYELPVRSSGRGFGEEPLDLGSLYGSPKRLQAAINLGPLSQYQSDPYSHVWGRGPTKDTPVSIMAHEAGHLFLAYVSVTDPANPGYLPMLGYQAAHWAFTFNSEASLLEGNRIRDDGAAANPRFTTTDNVQDYAPLDQYLMGFRAPEEVPPTFVVTNPNIGTAYRLPQAGVSFSGGRRDITVDDVIAAAGARVPDSTVAQRNFRFAIILLVPELVQPDQVSLDKTDTFRQSFESFYQQAASGRAQADTSLRKSMETSVFPAAGVVAGASMSATVRLAAPADADLVIGLTAGSAKIVVPDSVTIPAGETEASFDIAGVEAGVAELILQPVDGGYETVHAHIQVADGPAGLRFDLVSDDGQTVTARVSDGNDLAYPGLAITAVVEGDSNVTPLTSLTDNTGRAVFPWTASTGALKLTLAGGKSIEVTR